MLSEKMKRQKDKKSKKLQTCQQQPFISVEKDTACIIMLVNTLNKLLF